MAFSWFFVAFTRQQNPLIVCISNHLPRSSVFQEKVVLLLNKEQKKMVVEEKYMARCIELARGGEGNTAPNPMVGAVIVHKGKIIGEGFHRKCGEAHAEVNAVASVRDEALLAGFYYLCKSRTLFPLRKDTSLCGVDYKERYPARRGRHFGPVSRSVGTRSTHVARGRYRSRDGCAGRRGPCLESCFYDFPDTETPLCLSEMGPERRWVYGYPEGRCFCTFGAFVFSRDSPKGSSGFVPKWRLLWSGHVRRC